ncbi:class I SAM-dependent methyltransferase [Abyssisolibacter fermentans]|uniref:class I SAM-dependent methyltransferase n=1 Tax=Abyssisolibacter fermentans TaxID=1766203 RepID=UPI00083211E6|nr:class I SAM-dependent methyltransferase [Abyssisolibacter fermentans]
MSFYDDISKYYNYIFPLKNNKVDFVLDGVNDAQRILDIGCSTGELAKSLSEQGNFVVGIDLDEAMIKIAKGYENDNLKFHYLNMLRICDFFDTCYFDQIICFGNTLVHLNNDEEILVLFKAVRALLKKDGSFKFQIINPDYSYNVE